MHINNTQQKHSYREFIENFSFLFEEIKDKNSLSNEIRKEDESVYNAVVGFNTVKFLTRHTNWNWDEDKNKNKAYKVIPLEWNKIKKTEQKFESEVKARLKEYVDDITGVSIYGDHASITLGDGKKEFKISEFLNSDFCQKKGISGFSTLHSDGKSGMHGFVAGEGGKKIRHYVVTDGSYEMTLNWHDKNGKKCTIKIKIDKDGVDLVERNGVTEEQLKANTDVKIGGLFLHEIKFREKGRVNEVQHDGKDNQVLNKSSEIAIKSNSRDIEQEVKKPVQKHQATHMNREFGSQTPQLPPLRTSSLPPKENVVNEQGRNASTKPVSQDGGQRDKQNNPTPNNQQQPKTQQQEGNSNNNLLQGIINARKNLQHTGIDGREASIERNKENNPWKKLKEELPYLPFSDMHEHNSDNQGASDAEWEETLSAPKPNRGVSSPTVDHSQSQSDPKHLNRKFEKNHQRENKAPEEHGRNSKSETHKTPITNQAIGELKAVLEKLDERVKEQAQQVNEENISKDQFSKNVLQKIEIAGKEDNQNLDLLKKNSKISQSDVVKKREDSSNKPLSTISTEENIDVDDTQLTRFTSKLNEETQKFSLKPVDQEEQTKEHLLATGLLKDNAAEREINDSGYSSPTYTSHYNFQVNPEQLEKRLETIEPKDTLEKLNKGLREPSQYPPMSLSSQATKDLFSENMLEKIKEGEKYDPVRKLLERKVAEQENDNTNLTIDKNSELYKLLEKDAAQLKAGVIEEEKETEYTGSPDRNRVALANKNRKLLWTKRIADKQEKNDGISI